VYALAMGFRNKYSFAIRHWFAHNSSALYAAFSGFLLSGTLLNMSKNSQVKPLRFAGDVS
jgi:hypothetical protein